MVAEAAAAAAGDRGGEAAGAACTWTKKLTCCPPLTKLYYPSDLLVPCPRYQTLQCRLSVALWIVPNAQSSSRRSVGVVRHAAACRLCHPLFLHPATPSHRNAALRIVAKVQSGSRRSMG